MSKENILSILGWLLTLIAVYNYGLWIYESSRHEDFMEAVAAYKSHFAPYFQNRWDLTYLNIVLCGSAFYLFIIGLKTKNMAVRIINMFFLLLCCWILGLSIFSLM